MVWSTILPGAATPPSDPDRGLTADEDHIAAAHSGGKGIRQGGAVPSDRVGARQLCPVPAEHGIAFDLDQHAVIGEIGHGNGRDRGFRAFGQLIGQMPEEEVLVDRAVIDVEAQELDQIGQVGAEFAQDRIEIFDRADGLKLEVAGILNHAVAVEVDLSADPQHLAAADPVLMADADRPVPMALGPGMALFH